VPEGGTFTPKQTHLDSKSGKIYWSDREGMRVMCSNLDGSQIETLVEAGRGDADRGDQTRWCVGIMRRSLTEEEQHKIAGAIVDHLENHNWKIEQGPPREGHGPHLMSK
jgi:hypothetical protein